MYSMGHFENYAIRSISGTKTTEHLFLENQRQVFYFYFLMT